MTLTFKKATRTQAKLRMALIGPPGSGKTYTALNIATHLAAEGQRVAVIDTERGSASKYADGKPFDFDVLELDSFAPQTYTEAIQAAEGAGYDVLVIDSLSHAWIGEGGALEMVDKAAKRLKGNSYVAWGDVTPIYRAMFDAIVGARLHIIATMRSKTEYVLETANNGKTTPRKVGTAPQIRDGSEYEFDIVADLDIEHNLIVSKTRCPALDNAVIAMPGQQIADTLRAWLETGDALPIEQPSDAPQDATGAPPQAESATTGDNSHAGKKQPENGARWNEDKARVKKFADWYQHSQGLTHADALAALGVDKISAFQGTDAEAVAAIEAYVAEQLNTPPAAPAGAQAQPALLPDDAPPTSPDAEAIAA